MTAPLPAGPGRAGPGWGARAHTPKSGVLLTGDDVPSSSCGHVASGAVTGRGEMTTLPASHGGRGAEAGRRAPSHAHAARQTAKYPRSMAESCLFL